MNRRVYGIVGLTSRFANWNADFDGYPKRVQGKIYASDKSLKYVFRRYFKENGKDVFYLKDYDEKGNVLTYQDRYKKLFGLKKIGEKDKNTHIKNLLSFTDIKFFGTIATFKEKEKKKADEEKGKVNLGIRGIIQFTHGFDLNENTQVIREVITSQFASGEGKKTSTIGEQVLTDEAHYFYSFALNENNVMEYKNILGNDADILDITDEEYELFKKACLNAVDNYNSTSKAGCNNHFTLFVETEENVYMPNLADFLKMENKVLILDDLLKFLDENTNNIKNIELYYRPEYLKVKDIEKIDFAKEF